MRFAVISHGPSLLALDKARNHDVLLETVAFYSILGNTCKGTALKRLQGAMIRLCDQSIDRWMLSVPFLLPRPKAGGVLPMSLRPCCLGACQGKRGGTLVGEGHTHVGQRTLAELLNTVFLGALGGGCVFWCPVTAGFVLQCPSAGKDCDSKSLPGFI